MKLRITLAIAGIAALAISGGTATAGNGDKITGGGQVLFGTEGEPRSSTLAFTAQGTVDSAKGQVQLIDRSQGGKVRYHGVVKCVETGPGPVEGGGNYGIASGHKRGNAEEPFVLRVIDNGQGGGAEQNDMIAFSYGENVEPDTCGADNDDPDVGGSLAKGNAKVRDGDDGDENDPTFDDGGNDAVAVALGLL